MKGIRESDITLHDEAAHYIRETKGLLDGNGFWTWSHEPEDHMAIIY